MYPRRDKGRPGTALPVADDHYKQNVLDVAKPQNTVNNSVQQGTLLARNATRKVTIAHIVFQEIFHK